MASDIFILVFLPMSLTDAVMLSDFRLELRDQAFEPIVCGGGPVTGQA